MKKTIGILLLALLLALAGCIKVNTHEKIGASGLSNVTITMDFSKLLQGTGDQNGPAGGLGIGSLNPDTMCEQLLNQQNPEGSPFSGGTSSLSKISNPDCKASDNGIVTITGTYQHSENAFKKTENFWGNTYSFNPAESGLIEFPKGNQPIMGLGEGAAALTALKASGFSMTYQVEMPGIVFRVENGSISNNQAEFDLMGLAISQQKPLVESIEPNWIVAGIVGIIVLALIVWIILKFTRKKKPPATGSGTPAVSQLGSEPKHRHEREPVQDRPTKTVVPRRLRRQGRPEFETGTAMATEFEASRYAKPSLEEQHQDIASQLKAETQSPKRKRGKDELETLAEDLVEQSDREEKASKEVDELRQKLGSTLAGKIPTAPAVPEKTVESLAEQRHGRWRERRQQKAPATAPVQKPIQPTETEAQLEQLKKMEFKDLLKETEEGKEPEGSEEELKELEEGEKNEEDILEEEGEGPKKCPNCKKETDKVFFCPECGTAFCRQCAKSFKKQGNEEFYQCPSCEAYVKAASNH